MTASELKYQVEGHGHEPYFFTSKTMKFFGDTWRNYGVSKTTINTNYENGLSVYKLYRKNPVKHGLQTSAYFDADTFMRVNPR
jgi:hypothetical protein